MEQIPARPTKWKTFVANRVSRIQAVIPPSQWRHVPTEDNPADCASRGMLAKELMGHPLWWTGPSWLKQDSQGWPQPKAIQQVALEEKPQKEYCGVIKTVKKDVDTISTLISRQSSWFTLKKIMAYALRFIHNCRQRDGQRHGNLKTIELKEAETALIKTAQREFAPTIRRILDNSPLDGQNHLIKLNPFVDTQGMIRVGGRIENATIPYESRHPAIIPRDHEIAELIIQDIHTTYNHAGGQLTLNILRRRYWILRGRERVKQTIDRCITCRRFKQELSGQLMGILPVSRVNVSRPFLHTGIDYCGPFTVRAYRGRGTQRYSKAYIALFICMATKAIHIEVVSDLTTEAFLAALRRFVARRGICRHIYSDNGTNFKGADTYLQQVTEIVRKNEIRNECLRNVIEWHFIPPRAPHFGGIWEAGVKSVKSHLKRTMSNITLTYEELNTVVCQIEACVNSRPLTRLSEDIDDLTALTPAHFLTGEPNLSVCDENLLSIPTNRLSRWKVLQQQTQAFWQRWKNEYLHELQQRNKWTAIKPNMQIGTLVLVKEDNMAPAQ